MNWKRLYQDIAETYRALKPLFEEQYAASTVRIDRRGIRLANEVWAKVQLENYPPRIVILFDESAILNIYGRVIVNRIREARGELVGQLAEQFGMQAKASAKIDGRWQRRLDIMTLYKTRENVTSE